MKTSGRDEAPFEVRVEVGGQHDLLLARAVIDASGTYQHPNPLGVGGLPAEDEDKLATHIRYAIPDALGAERERYAGKRVLVVGSGHSAFNALLDLCQLKPAGTRVLWAIRRGAIGTLFGGGKNDKLLERGRLGARIQGLVASGDIELFTAFGVRSLERTEGGIAVIATDDRRLDVDEVIATTGFRPDLDLTRELRLSLDPALESPSQLAPLIDPNVHSCGSVPPHGESDLAHPEKDFYVVGMKSYGRAPTFLMITGYEQIRSIVAALSGDWEAARKVELVLPETGVCSTDKVSCELPLAAASCCPTATAPAP